ncbi:hypothetical protein NIES592_08255 [Fischerella major NIES-592]|uniref:Uncharacterized protein n=2 Tax=Fischerella TaxID=1190 RepID=A0A1U7H1I8_9CYAN|nr:hypothetical protein NIES592_08255 [Fischerella major NIES-592]
MGCEKRLDSNGNTFIVIPFHENPDTNPLPSRPPCPPCLPCRQMYQTYGETVLGVIGGVIGIAVIFSNLSDAKAAAGFGLAGTAIAGASGLAQSTKKE